MSAPNAAAGSQPHALPTVVNAHRCPPGNFYPGRAGYQVLKFIRHNTETPDAGNAPSLGWFLDPTSQRSVQHLVARDGTRYDLVQRVDTAFHCGDSAIPGFAGSVWVPAAPPAWPARVPIALLSLISIGMEFESSSTLAHPGDGYTDAQLWTGAHCEATTIISYGLDPQADCLDHLQIARPAGRRHDPSWFPYDTYRQYVSAWLTFLRAVPAAELPRYCI